MTDPAPTTTTTTPTPWYQHPDNWGAILTVFTLVLTGLGYTISAQDQQTIVVTGGGSIVGLIQVFGVIRRILASKS